jgi:hypothetical protein
VNRVHGGGKSELDARLFSGKGYGDSSRGQRRRSSGELREREKGG